MASQLKYELVEGWEKRPPEITYRDVVGVGIDAKDRVYVLTRMDARVIVYERDGTFAGTFGEGLFTGRTHGLTIAPDGSTFAVDDGDNTVRKFSADGKLLMTIGTVGVASDTGANMGFPLYEKLLSITHGGDPFNGPTDVAIAPNGELYVSDGYLNARVHRFTADGKLIQSWGEPGVGPGEFNLPHGIWVVPDGRVFVADRENDRIQIFGPSGEFLEEWLDVQRPSDVFVDSEGLVYVSEMPRLRGWRSFRLPLHKDSLHGRVSVYDLKGNVLARFGGPDMAAPGNFWAGHTICADSHGDIYVGEVTYTFSGQGRAGLVPEGVHILQKFARVR